MLREKWYIIECCKNGLGYSSLAPIWIYINEKITHTIVEDETSSIVDDLMAIDRLGGETPHILVFRRLELQRKCRTKYYHSIEGRVANLVKEFEPPSACTCDTQEYDNHISLRMRNAPI